MACSSGTPAPKSARPTQQAHAARAATTAVASPTLPPAPAAPPAPPRPVAPLSSPPPPPKLACAEGAKPVRAAFPDPTWACVRDDGTRDGPFVIPFPDGTPEITGSYAAGKLDGPWERHYPSGALARAGAYKAGLQDGHWKQLDPQGQLVAESDLVAGTGKLHLWFLDGEKRDVTLKAGVPNGPATTWAPDGSVLVKESFHKGRLSGERTSGNRHSIYLKETRYGNSYEGARKVERFGVPFLDENYDNAGRFDGLWTTWRDRNVPRISGSYDHGHRDGTWTWTDRDNNKEREGNYIKGQRDGVWTEWTENQPTLVGTYVAGKLDGTWIVTDKTGAELGRYDLADGTGTVLTFWPNKKVSSKTAMYKGSQDGPYVELSPRGKVMLDGHFSGDRKHGAWKTFTEGGQLVTESHWRHGRLDKDVTKLDSGSEDLHGTFKDGRATGAYRELRGGKPAVTGQLVDDKRDGTWTEYAADGTVRLISTYKAGVLNGPWHQVTAGVTLDGELVNGRRAGTWTRTDASGATTTIQY